MIVIVIVIVWINDSLSNVVVTVIVFVTVWINDPFSNMGVMVIVIVTVRVNGPLQVLNKTLRSVHFGVVVVELINCRCGGIVRSQMW